MTEPVWLVLFVVGQFAATILGFWLGRAEWMPWPRSLYLHPLDTREPTMEVDRG